MFPWEHPVETEAELAEVWRRQFACLDVLVYGFLRAEDARRAGRDPGPAAVTLGDLSSARHMLSGPLYHPRADLAWEHFRFSDPVDELYAGKLEAELQRERAERDARFE
jgi:hypothetical protein